MMQDVVVDRIEGAFAVLEVSGQTVDWPLSALPPGMAEGTRLLIRIEVAGGDTAQAEARLARLRAKGPKGDTFDL